MVLLVLALPVAYLLDIIIGDPVWSYHPVRVIGRCIELFEGMLRRMFPDTNTALRIAGVFLAAIVPLIFFAVAAAIMVVAYKINIILWFVLESVLCYQLIAVRDLYKASMKVYDKLRTGGIPAARQAVSMIVGRDTENLDESQIARAAVETVAESTADGIVAPMLHMAVGGAPFGLWYKAVNTLDSMVGYKNDRYIDFGRASAKLDDIANFLPSRIGAMLMLCGARLARLDAKEARRIYLRDRKNHSSPNSGQTEAVCAGALAVQLGGTSMYFGKPVEKPTMGEDIRPIVAEDIRRANRLMIYTSLLCLGLCTLIRWATVYLVLYIF